MFKVLFLALFVFAQTESSESSESGSVSVPDAGIPQSEPAPQTSDPASGESQSSEPISQPANVPSVTITSSVSSSTESASAQSREPSAAPNENQRSNSTNVKASQNKKKERNQIPTPSQSTINSNSGRSSQRNRQGKNQVNQPGSQTQQFVNEISRVQSRISSLNREVSNIQGQPQDQIRLNDISQSLLQANNQLSQLKDDLQAVAVTRRGAVNQITSVDNLMGSLARSADLVQPTSNQDVNLLQDATNSFSNIQSDCRQIKLDFIAAM
ncbi:hypothetical protein HK103_000840 [Boothiomyces macroporosus]|uniref:Uncharacterized protein n=1 Tax=Boothiomyces macroporosus TaxID=261099 RepID=A0AAD5Y5C3_9FUNG|nr:hypothetical protein HK103_000840 [Boothiomyces macroporosus]